MPLNREAERINRLADNEGAFVLKSLGKAKFSADRYHDFHELQRDGMARSTWCYLKEYWLFEAAEAALHARSFREYKKHYQSFEIEAGCACRVSDAGFDTDAIINELSARLGFGPGCRAEQFELPSEEDEPSAIMLLIYFPDSPSSAHHLHDDGVREIYYFRPPGEAVVIYTPENRTLEVCTRSSNIRPEVAESVAQAGLGQDLSKKPLAQKDYDLSRFLGSLEVDTPKIDGFEILRAGLVLVEVSPLNRRTRLSFRVSKSQDLTEMVDGVCGLSSAISGAVAIRKVGFQVCYVSGQTSQPKSLSFDVTDRNTCTLQGVEDTEARQLGRQLLVHWRVLREFRSPSQSDLNAMLPVLLKLYDQASDRLSGSWFAQRNINADALVEHGVLMRAGLEDFDVVDEEGDWSLDVAIRPVARGNVVQMVSVEGAEQLGGVIELHRLYKIDRDWIQELIRKSLSEILSGGRYEKIDDTLCSLGNMEADGHSVPIYLARRLGHDGAFGRIAKHLDERRTAVASLVFCAGEKQFDRIGANVVLPLADFLEGTGELVELRCSDICAAYTRVLKFSDSQWLVKLECNDDASAELFIPNKQPLQLTGRVKVSVFRKLVEAHDRCRGPQKVASLLANCDSSSMNDVFKKDWSHLKAEYLRSPKTGYWELAV